MTCPDGEVAVAVRMNYDNDAFTGIELQCAEVVWTPCGPGTKPRPVADLDA